MDLVKLRQDIMALKELWVMKFDMVSMLVASELSLYKFMCCLFCLDQRSGCEVHFNSIATIQKHLNNFSKRNNLVLRQSFNSDRPADTSSVPPIKVQSDYFNIPNSQFSEFCRFIAEFCKISIKADMGIHYEGYSFIKEKSRRAES
ncbi:hypothetical protein BpHYR1_005826 [Brachionus plicatilis]|uniref:Uncharacterized protein n=1 Tax=Brachionus plicatilis TaxID=10195 RepID=A0A3M7PHI7_BRAPC|nr:hypothetical protein BpHYR1_005826 [Brachionus plicatilis]